MNHNENKDTIIHISKLRIHYMLLHNLLLTKANHATPSFKKEFISGGGISFINVISIFLSSPKFTHLSSDKTFLSCWNLAKSKLQKSFVIEFFLSLKKKNSYKSPFRIVKRPFFKTIWRSFSDIYLRGLVN